MYKVFIVDDHELISNSLSNVLNNLDDFEVVGTIKNAAYTEICCLKLEPDLIFMDVCTEDGSSGLDATEIIKKSYPNIKVIVMSGFDEITYAPRAREVGADAFVYKSKDIDYFVNVARAVLAGKQIFPKKRTIPTPSGEKAPLTEREMEVLRLMCRHMTNKEIADALFITEHTVKYHKSNMLAKTGFDKAVDLAFYMVLNGYINPLY